MRTPSSSESLSRATERARSAFPRLASPAPWTRALLGEQPSEEEAASTMTVAEACDS